ncbi:BLUF domain-containing protein [Variovorax sp. J22P168]|uniref:BLUF domain-containing protein n=1 Tax=Variovorax jilinensis TaxID=3053513 RepID=UPI002577659E|nr:BLUF domain-containing protein [Variovorax sp. J22P168]MDM0011267.1 BLUF domain-containing protein [Variovorax sp. J22P168]
MSDLHEILYISLLAPDQPTQVVGRIVAQARARNAANAITGLLVFDGMRFCQHLEGPRDAVQALLSRLQADPRHAALEVLHQGALTQRRYQRFEMGLAQVEHDDDHLAGIATLRAEEALQCFLALRPRFDISG